MNVSLILHLQNLPGELWKPINGFEGLYEISNMGRVFSFARQGNNGDTILKQNGIKHKSVSLCKHGLQSEKNVSLLVWDHFGNKKRNGNLICVFHINKDFSDNRIENLELIHHKLFTEYVGVRRDKTKKKWISEISINGKTKHLGTFKTAYLAYLARLKKIEEEKNETISNNNHVNNLNNPSSTNRRR